MIGRVLAMLAVVLLGSAFSGQAHAGSPRPYDAPRVDGPIRVPPAPAEYLTDDRGFIRFAYHPSARKRVLSLMAHAEPMRRAIEAALGRPTLASVEVRVAAVPAEMSRLSPVELPGYVDAVAISDANLVIMSLTSALSLEPPDLEAALRHELAHVALDEVLDHRPVPRWFHEGFAAHVGGADRAGRVERLIGAALRGRLVGIAELEASFPEEAPRGSLAYAQAANLVGFLAADERAFAELLDRIRDGEPFDHALAAAYDQDLPALDAAWQRDLRKRYALSPVLALLSLVGLLVATAIVIRRKRLARAKSEARRPPRRRPRRDVRDRDERARQDRLLPPDQGVPKVSHGGRWHTLH